MKNINQITKWCKDKIFKKLFEANVIPDWFVIIIIYVFTFSYMKWNSRLFHYINERVGSLGSYISSWRKFQSFCLVLFEIFLVCFSSSLCNVHILYSVHWVITSKINSYIYLNKFSIFYKCHLKFQLCPCKTTTKKIYSNFYISDKGNMNI